MKVPFFQGTLGENEVQAASRAINSGWVTTGQEVRDFESEFAAYVHADYAVAVNSCTAALHLSLVALGVEAGDEVLVPTMTFAATAEVCLAVGAEPVLVDCDPLTLKIDLADARSKISDRTRAIMPMHYGGSAVDMRVVRALADEANLVVIEDAAHALPTTFDGSPIGGLSEATCFSFYANKTLSTGEGGMFTTNNRELADAVRQLSLHGLTSNAWGRFRPGGSWEYDIAVAGWKYNLTDIAGAIGREQLKRCDEMAERRRAVLERYRDEFTSDERLRMVDGGEISAHSAHLAVVLLETELLTSDRNEVIVDLNEAGIGTSVHYKPLHMHSLYLSKPGSDPDLLPNATRAFERNITLPLYPTMSSDETGYVISTMREILDGAS